MYAFLTAICLLAVPSDLSNHWRWSSASVNQSEASPIPPDIKPIPNPSPNPVPVPTPPTPTPVPNLKPGDDCPKCVGGYIPSDGSAKVKCWQCGEDGIVNEGDPILTLPPSLAPTVRLPKCIEPLINSEIKDGKQSNVDKTTEETQEKDGTTPAQTNLVNESDKNQPDETGPIEKQVCYKPQYSPEGYWILDPEANTWIRSGKKPPTTKQVTEPGHWETKTKKVYTSCCGWQTQTYKVWVKGSTKTVTQQPKPSTSYYPVRNSWWTGCRNWQHLTKGQHVGKFDPSYLQKLSWEELQSLHSDHHSGTVKWEYVNR